MYNQQGFQGGQQSSFAQGNRYQPAGYAQSQSQGMSNSSFPSQQSRPVISYIGSTGGAPSGVYSNGYNNTNQSGDRANFGPVIDHLGYEAGADFGGMQKQPQRLTAQNAGGMMSQNSGQYQSGMGRSQFQQSGFGASGGYGGFSNTVPQGGFQSSMGMGSMGSMGSMGMGSSIGTGYQQSGFSGAQGGYQSSFGQGGAVTPENPVYKATQAYRQEGGPVIQQLGYQAGNDASQSYGMNTGFQGGYQTGFQGGNQGR